MSLSKSRRSTVIEAEVPTGPAIEPADGHPQLPPRQIKRVFFGVMIAMLLGAMDQTIVSPALPTIGRSLGDVENLSWVVTAYLLTSTAVTPLYGKLADIYGRRFILLLGLFIYMASSVLCALAPNMLFLIFARALQGLGGGGLVSLVQTIVADLVSARERGRYMGYFVTAAAGLSVGGPLVGGLLTQYSHWSMIFWLNVPLGLLGMWTTNNVLKGLPNVRHPHKLDIVGASLMVAASVLLLLALTWGGVRYQWFSLQIGLLAAGSLVLWALFGWRLTAAAEPFLPLRVLGNKVVRNGFITRGLVQGVVAGMTIFMPLYFELVHHLSVSQSGLVLIPMLVAMVTGGQSTGQMVSYFGRYKIFPMLTMPISALALFGLGLWANDWPLPATFALLALFGLCTGPVLPISTIMVQNVVTRSEMGITTSALNFARNFGGALVVALFSAILLGGAGGEGVSISALMRGGSSAIDFGTAFRYMFFTAAGLVLLGFVFFAMTKEQGLRTTPPPKH